MFRRAGVPHVRTFPSLWAADAALAALFAEAAPTAADAYAYSVTWADDETHQGVVDIRPRVLAAAGHRGGILRAQLTDYVAHIGSSEWVRDIWRRDPADVVRIQAWAAELRRRLAFDLRDEREPRRPRNVSPRATPC